MRGIRLLLAALVTFSMGVTAQGGYKVIKTAKVGGDGGFDYVYADSNGRRLYIPRSAPANKIAVFNLDTLKPVGEIPNVSAHGVAVDPKSHHGFATSKPVVMWNTKNLKVIKTIDVLGNPDGVLFDSFNQRVYILSHVDPNVTVIDSKDGSIVGTINLGGAPEQAVSDGKGHLYIDLENKDRVSVVDAATLKVMGRYGLGKSKTPAGLAFDVQNNILFVGCRNPYVSVIMNAADGKILNTLPIGAGVDGAGFMPKTSEAFSSQSDGTLTVIKETSPADFAVEQTVTTMPSAKTMTIDYKTGHIFLIGAEFGPAPERPGIGGRPRRGPMLADSFTILEVGQ